MSSKLSVCGKAFVAALLQHPEYVSAVKTLLNTLLVSVEQQLIQATLQVDRLDVGNKVLDSVLGVVREETSKISRYLDIYERMASEFSDCADVIGISNQIDSVKKSIQQKATAVIRGLTKGKAETLGDLDNLAYEAQRRSSLRKQVNVAIEVLIEEKEMIQAFLDELEEGI